MGNAFGKYSEWEVEQDDELENNNNGEQVEEMVIENKPAEANVELVVEAAEPNHAVEQAPVVQQPAEEQPLARTPKSVGRGRSRQGSNLQRGASAEIKVDEAPVVPEPAPPADQTGEEMAIEPETPTTGKAKRGRGRTNSGLGRRASTASVIVEDEIVLETPKPKRGASKSNEGSFAAEVELASTPTQKKKLAEKTDSQLKRKRTESFSTTAPVSEPSVEEEPVVEEPVVEKPITKKRATSNANVTASATKKGARKFTSDEAAPSIAIKQELVGGLTPHIIDHQNYSTRTREELAEKPRRSLRQTPLKEEPSPKSSKKARAPKADSPRSRSPSPKRKLFGTPPKKESPVQTPAKRGRKPGPKKATKSPSH